MSFDVLLLLLRLAFLGLLYVFLFAVVKAAWSGLRSAATLREAVARPASLVRLRVVATGNNGLGGQAFDLWSSATIGRAPDNTVVLADGSVSAHHAAIRQERGQWWIEDLRSTNGTAVNDTLVRDTAPVYPSDLIRLGQVQLRLEVDDARG